MCCNIAMNHLHATVANMTKLVPDHLRRQIPELTKAGISRIQFLLRKQRVLRRENFVISNKSYILFLSLNLGQFSNFA